MAADASLLLDQFLYGITRRRGRLLDILDIQLLRLSCLSSALCDRDLLQGLHRIQHDLHGHRPLGAAEHPFPWIVTHHRETHFHGIRRLEINAELSLQVRHCHLSLRQTGDGHQFQGILVFIDDFSLQGEAIGHQDGTRQEHRQHQRHSL